MTKQRKAAAEQEGDKAAHGRARQRNAAEQRQHRRAAEGSKTQRRAKAAEGGNKGSTKRTKAAKKGKGSEARQRAAEGGTEEEGQRGKDQEIVFSYKTDHLNLSLSYISPALRRLGRGPADFQPRHLDNGGLAQKGPRHQHQARRSRRARARLPGTGPAKPNSRRGPRQRPYISKLECKHVASTR